MNPHIFTVLRVALIVLSFASAVSANNFLDAVRAKRWTKVKHYLQSDTVSLTGMTADDEKQLRENLGPEYQAFLARRAAVPSSSSSSTPSSSSSSSSPSSSSSSSTSSAPQPSPTPSLIPQEEPPPRLTIQQAIALIRSENKEMSDEDVRIGAQILADNLRRFKGSDEILTRTAKSYIKNSLIGLIAAKKKAIVETKETEEARDVREVKEAKETRDAREAAQPKETEDINKERQLLEQVADLAGSGKKADLINLQKWRYLKFVILLPPLFDLPRRHPGADDRIHLSKSLAEDVKNILEVGASTRTFLKKHGSRVCPNLIYLRGPASKELDPLTFKLHMGHTLADFARTISEEKEEPLELHFAGHSSPSRGLGTMISDARMDPESLADLFAQSVQLCGLEEVLQARQILFYFDVCNAAYADLSDSDSDEVIKEKLVRQSVMGRFFTHLRSLGYTNFKVLGYRGFYQLISDGAGIRLLQSLTDTKGLSATDAIHTIEAVPGESTKVILPKATYAKLKVTLPPP